MGTIRAFDIVRLNGLTFVPSGNCRSAVRPSSLFVRSNKMLRKSGRCLIEKNSIEQKVNFCYIHLNNSKNLFIDIFFGIEFHTFLFDN